jgi:hypothetical protein
MFGMAINVFTSCFYHDHGNITTEDSSLREGVWLEAVDLGLGTLLLGHLTHFLTCHGAFGNRLGPPLTDSMINPGEIEHAGIPLSSGDRTAITPEVSLSG